MHHFGISLAESCYGHKMPVLGVDKLDRRTVHFQSLPLSQKRLLFIKLLRENKKTFKKHFTRKEARNLRPCTDSIATSDVEVMAQFLKLACMWYHLKSWTC